MLRYAIASVVLSAVTWLGLGRAGAQSILEKSRSDTTVSVRTGDANMAAAMQKAKSRLPEFLKLAKAPTPGATGFAVKIGIPYDEGNEFVWMNSLEFKGDRIIGAINNEPRFAKNVRYRQRISFREGDIADWMYRENGKMKGNFTACAMLKNDTAANRDAFRKEYGLECEP
jgi:uncharacterized protein YegJ (DUF2314 family)